MSTMHTPPMPGYGIAPETRTSLAAVFALIFGLLGMVACCIPFVGVGVSVVGVLLGVIGLVAISSSDGRIKGRGMALTGLITGIIGAAVGIFVIVGMNVAVNVLQAYPRMAEAAMAKDHAAVVAGLDSTSSGTFTPEQLAKFADDVEAAVGPGATFHGNFMDLFRGGKILGTQPASAQVQSQYPGRNIIPFYVQGSTRNAALLIVNNPMEESPEYQAGKVTNMIVVPEGSGDAIYLIDLEPKPN